MLEFSVVGAAIIVGLCQAMKAAGVPSKFIPLISVFIGVTGAIFLIPYSDGAGLANTVVQGIIIGLSAVGLYSGVKSTIK
jgi:hypothetical protein